MAVTPLNSDYFNADSLSVAVTGAVICAGTDDDAPPGGVNGVTLRCRCVSVRRMCEYPARLEALGLISAPSPG